MFFKTQKLLTTVVVLLLWRKAEHERGGMKIAPWSSLEPEHSKSDRAPLALGRLPPIAAGLSKCGQTLPGAAAKLLPLFPPVCPSAQAIRFVLPCFCKGIWQLQNMSHYWLEVVTIWWLFRWSGTNEWVISIKFLGDSCPLSLSSSQSVSSSLHWALIGIPSYKRPWKLFPQEMRQ